MARTDSPISEQNGISDSGNLLYDTPPEWLDDRRRLALKTFIDEVTNPKDELGKQKKRMIT